MSKILNLTDLEKSEIKYKISNFPDTQKNISITLDNSHSIVGHLGDLDAAKLYGVTIKSRMQWNDIQTIICAVANLRELDIEKIHLYVPYFLGARSDRQFEEGENRYLKDVICPIINSLKLASVTVLDPHSTVLENLLNNFKVISNKKILNWMDIESKSNKIDFHPSNCVWVAPDAGASHKIYKLAESCNFKGDIIACSKERDAQGNPWVDVPVQKIDFSKDIIIIDDICDGGKTFIEIAKTLKACKGCKNKIYLIVTHGIFSKGFLELEQYFDGIYCTNSVGILPNNSNIFNAKNNNLLKTLDVF